MDKNIDRFWKSFRVWYETVFPYMNYIKSEYTNYDNWNGGMYFLNIDFDYEYKLHLGIDYTGILENDFPTIGEIKTLIELTYDEFVSDRYNFTVDVNNLCKKFNIPYRLKTGKFIEEVYKTTNQVGKIYNYAQLERKIRYSEEMIMSEALLDKKAALDYIVDSLQYLISICEGNGNKQKLKNSAIKVAGCNNNKIYAVISKELDEIMKISNEFFDIRHNEYFNKAKEKREILNDGIFIEYLYNRIYNIVHLLRIKYK